MKKNKYYIKVGSGEILPERTMSEWEFEIIATPEEAMRLRQLLEETNSESNSIFLKAHIPMQEDYDEENIPYDKKLRQVYQLIHDLGTDETKEHIQSMGILH